MRNEDTLIEVDRRFNDQKEFINAKFTHISAIMQNAFEAAAKERVEIITHQKETNGRVTKLECKTKWIDVVRKNRIALVAIVIVAVFGLSLLANNIDFKKTLEKQTDIVLKTE